MATKKRAVFVTLEKAVDNAAQPKGVLAVGVKNIILKLLDLVEVGWDFNGACH